MITFRLIAVEGFIVVVVFFIPRHLITKVVSALVITSVIQLYLVGVNELVS